MVVIGIGIYAWIFQLQEGLIVTGMRNIVSWGLYITLFVFFVGASAGGLVVSSSTHVFEIEEFKPIARVSIILAAACVAVAALSIIPDLGRPERIPYLIIYGNTFSPLIWDFIVIIVYLFLCIADLWFMMRAELASKGSCFMLGFNDTSQRAVVKDEKVVRAISFVALPTAIMLHTITAWIFGTQIARSWWHTALIAPIFLASAIMSGLSLVVLTILVLQWRTNVKVPDKTFHLISRLLAVIILVDLFLKGNDFLIRLWAATPSEILPLTLLLKGPFLPFFAIEWVLGAVLPLILLLHPKLRGKPRVLGLTALLVLTGVLAYRAELVILAYVYPPILFPPGIPIGEFKSHELSFNIYGIYYPTWVELTIAVAFFAVLIFVVTVAIRVLPIWGAEKNIN
jgi:molybdopterin-containing oxidoreductase family membrane subunit